MHATSVPRRKSSVAFLCLLVTLVDGIHQPLGIGLRLAADVAVAAVAGEPDRVVPSFLVGDLARPHTPKHARGYRCALLLRGWAFA
jgi:hypothetical protein